MKWREQFLVYRKCSVCGGSRLKKEALQFRIGGKSIADVSGKCIPMSPSAAAPSSASHTACIATSPVSYTHLDVYKRQYLARLPVERRFLLQRGGILNMTSARTSR